MRRVRSAELTARPGVKVRVFAKADQNIVKDDVERVLGNAKTGKTAGSDEVTQEYPRSGERRVVGGWLQCLVCD